ncbi:VWA domain-containing protein [Lutibacter sp.]|uniref:VWA domain-containing protein n=1 Tax=Lutibacter sp. TaxID=1925666 RepID=UPI002736B623|nr:VWA domain-containing protein [Lutibacter sp.]MDP3311898.1 VWA domain-containing protein [Lutibacter sp.]
MGLATVFQVILAVLIALFVSYFQYFHKTTGAKSNIAYLLSFLRFCTIFLVIILLFNPSIESTSSEITKPKLLIVADNSASIKYFKKEDVIINLITLFQKNKKLIDKFDIQYFSFGSGIKLLDSLNFKESQTNLSKPFTEFQSIYKKGINPVVLISDGNQTIGKSIEHIKYSSPVYSLIVGDTTKLEDISISQLNINQVTYINNKFPIELVVNYTGSKIISKKIEIFYKNKSVYSDILLFNGIDNTKTVSIFLNATMKGNQFYTAKIESLTNEKNTLNNSKEFSINVIEDQTNIILLSSINHPDVGMFKKSIESSKQRKVTVSLIKDFKENLNNYQLVILYQPNSQFKTIFNILEDTKKNYFIITGLSTDWTFLNGIQPNFSKKNGTSSSIYFASYNNSYATFLSTDLGFEKFPPLEDNSGDITLNKESQTLLYQKDINLNNTKPLAVTIENSEQKIGVLFGENSWKWRMESFKKNQHFEEFDTYFSNLFQYLASNSNATRLQVFSNPFYYGNDQLKISAIYLDNNYNFDYRAKLWLNLSKVDEKFEKRIPFSLFESRFNLELPNLPFGIYNYSITVENEDDSFNGTFKIIPFEVEHQFVNANDDVLKQFSENTEGKLFYADQIEMLLKELEEDSRFKGLQSTKTENTPLIDWKWLLGLLLFFLSLEWFTRKYYGKI